MILHFQQKILVLFFIIIFFIGSNSSAMEEPISELANQKQQKAVYYITDLPVDITQKIASDLDIRSFSQSIKTCRKLKQHLDNEKMWRFIANRERFVLFPHKKQKQEATSYKSLIQSYFSTPAIIIPSTIAITGYIGAHQSITNTTHRSSSCRFEGINKRGIMWGKANLSFTQPPSLEETSLRCAFMFENEELYLLPPLIDNPSVTTSSNTECRVKDIASNGVAVGASLSDNGCLVPTYWHEKKGYSFPLPEGVVRGEAVSICDNGSRAVGYIHTLHHGTVAIGWQRNKNNNSWHFEIFDIGPIQNLEKIKISKDGSCFATTINMTPPATPEEDAPTKRTELWFFDKRQGNSMEGKIFIDLLCSPEGRWLLTQNQYTYCEFVLMFNEQVKRHIPSHYSSLHNINSKNVLIGASYKKGSFLLNLLDVETNQSYSKVWDLNSTENLEPHEVIIQHFTFNEFAITLIGNIILGTYAEQLPFIATVPLSSIKDAMGKSMFKANDEKKSFSHASP